MEERERDEKEEEEVVEEVEDVRFVSASTLLSPFPPYDFTSFMFSAGFSSPESALLPVFFRLIT